jgi:HD-like signal output (HDOD) protein
VLQLLRLVATAGDGQPLADIVSVLRTDAVLTGQVLRLANSPLFAARCEIKNVLQAVSFLGLERVNALLVTTAMRSIARDGRGNAGHSCWRHNLATALIAQRLSKRVGIQPERAYVAGLMHDIGCVALLRLYPEYLAVVARGEAAGESMMATERAAFGIDHGEAGRFLLEQWRCPSELQNVTAMHEKPESTPDDVRPLLYLVHASSTFADAMSMSVTPLTHPPKCADGAAFLPEALADSIEPELEEMEAWVATSVNEIELSLV